MHAIDAILIIIVLLTSCTFANNYINRTDTVHFNEFCPKATFNLDDKGDVIEYRIICQPNITCDLTKLLTVSDKKSSVFIRLCRFTDFVIQEKHFKTLRTVVEVTLEDNSIVFLFTENYAKPFNELINMEQISVLNNNIEYIDPNLFYFPKLKKICFRNNRLRSFDLCKDKTMPITHLDLGQNRIRSLEPTKSNSSGCESELKGLTQLLELIELRVDNNYIQLLEPKSFSKLTHLEYLDLSGNNLTCLTAEMFLENKNLTTFKLNNNKQKLESIPSRFFADKPKLETVEMSGCNIQTLPVDMFENSLNLKYLILSHNNLMAIQINLLNDKENLELLDLSYNNIRELNKFYFEKFTKIKKILLSHNLIHSMDPFALKIKRPQPTHRQSTQESLVHLEELDLSFNRIRSLTFTQIVFTQENAMLSINLTQNQIEELNFPDKSLDNNAYGNEITIHLDDNPVHCGCKILDFIKFAETNLSVYTIMAEHLECVSPMEVNGQSVTKINAETFSLNVTTFPTKRCTHSFRCIDNCLVVNCSNLHLTSLPDIEIGEVPHNIHSIELFIENNALTNLPDLQKNPTYNFVKKLFARNNRIEEEAGCILSQDLTFLDLRDNNMRSLKVDSEMRMTKMFLSNNPWHCECDFITFTKEHIQFIMDFDNITCDDRAIQGISIADICYKKKLKSNNTEIILIAVLVILVLISIVTAFYYKFQQEVKVWMYAHKCCMWFISEEDLDKDKVYDAFLSYSHMDLELVRDCIIPKLENGKPEYRLCLHERDWEVGAFITDSIFRSIEESRRTIVILSANYIKSIWGEFEFQTAHTKALIERRIRVIVVVYGDIGDIEKLDPTFKLYLRTNTYIKWEDPWFWKKLRYALPHRGNEVVEAEFDETAL